MSAFTATKLVRQDFPDEMPKEVVDRILKAQEARDRLSWISVTGYVVIAGGAIAAMIAGFIGTWPSWTPGAAMAGMGIMSILINRLSARDLHLALVEQNMACAKCGAPLATPTWSVTQQQVERDAFLRQRCPRCHEPVVLMIRS